MLNTNSTFGRWLARWTTLGELPQGWLDAPSEGFSAWARTTAGVVLMLLAVQFVTGVLLAFHYVPTTDYAYVSVAYLEKVVAAGSWVRSLHYHASQWLPVALVAHLAQMLGRRAYGRVPVAWVASLVLLGLVLGAATMGYALPWDARSLNGANIGLGLAGSVPFVGAAVQGWLLQGSDISTLTLSRFYGLHVFVMPALILTVAAARLFIFRDRPAPAARSDGWAQTQLARNALVVLLVFIALALVAAKWPTPLGPPAQNAADYLPRPGPQFLWLFESLKYLSGLPSILFAAVFPGLLLGGLMLLPLVKANAANAATRHKLAWALFAAGFGLVAGLTALALWQDARDPRTREQLARQAQEEAEFRAAPFKPKHIPADGLAAAPEASANVAQAAPGSAASAVPPAYTQQCAKCHGAQGEGKPKFPPLIGMTTRAEEPRTVADLVGIMDNPVLFGLEKRMPAFADKLSEDEKKAIAEWLATLK